MKCARCGNDGQELVCRECGERLSPEQSRELAAVYRTLVKLGGSTQEYHPRGDEFYTPPQAIEILLPFLPVGKTVWEVAWGQGHLAKVLKCHGFKVQGRAGVDFLTATPPEFDLIVSNPPFSLKDEFLIRAYTLGKPFALLLPLEALFGVKRSPLYMAHGLQLLVPNRRIQFFNADGLPCNFHSCWFCWQLLPRDLMWADMPR